MGILWDEHLVDVSDSKFSYPVITDCTRILTPESVCFSSKQLPTHIPSKLAEEKPVPLELPPIKTIRAIYLPSVWGIANTRLGFSLHHRHHLKVGKFNWQRLFITCSTEAGRHALEGDKCAFG